MCLIRSIFANLCPIMILLNALDINVCHFEEVISFFWRSVYVLFDILQDLRLYGTCASNPVLNEISSAGGFWSVHLFCLFFLFTDSTHVWITYWMVSHSNTKYEGLEIALVTVNKSSPCLKRRLLNYLCRFFFMKGTKLQAK